jgi:hypothetical protein
LQEQLIVQTVEADAARNRGETIVKVAQTARDQHEKDQTELLRLRGEVGRLRQQKDELDNLRKQNNELTAALTKSAQSNNKAAEGEADPERQAAIAHMNDARQLVLGLIMFVEDNQQTLPATLNQTSNYWGGASRLITNQFELVLQRPLKDVPNPSQVIAVRQKEAWFSKGNWVKAYGFADGHAEIKRQPAEGFEAWEQAHILPPR